jgi:hypothetical protein
LLPSLPLFSFFFIIRWRHHYHWHRLTRFSQHHIRLHSTRMDPRTMGERHELNFRTASEKGACENLRFTSSSFISSATSSSICGFRDFGWKQRHYSWRYDLRLIDLWGSLRFWIRVLPSYVVDSITIWDGVAILLICVCIRTPYAMYFVLPTTLLVVSYRFWKKHEMFHVIPVT